MSAAITATGTWTPITGLKLTGLADPTKANLPAAENLNFESLKTPDGVVLPELRQFIQAAALGYNISYWAAADLLEILMRAMRNSATPSQLGNDTGSRLAISPF